MEIYSILQFYLFPPCTGGCIAVVTYHQKDAVVSSLYGRVYYPQEDIMFGLKSIFEKTAEKALLTREEIADFIKTNPEALRAFEESYSKHVINKDSLSDNFFAINAKQMANERKKYLISDIVADSSYLDAIIQRIVAELLDSAAVYVWDGKEDHFETFDSLPENYVPVSNDEIKKIPESQRPELTGFRYKRDISEDDAGKILWVYREYLKCKNSAKKRKLYGMFFSTDIIKHSCRGSVRHGKALGEIAHRSTDFAIRATGVRYPIIDKIHLIFGKKLNLN